MIANNNLSNYAIYFQAIKYHIERIPVIRLGPSYLALEVVVITMSTELCLKVTVNVQSPSCKKLKHFQPKACTALRLDRQTNNDALAEGTYPYLHSYM